MKIIYVAKHRSGGNDDEGSIAFALEQLGHEVVKVLETSPDPVKGVHAAGQADLILFHKWGLDQRELVTDIPRVFWYFDLVEWFDPLLEVRCRQRKQWMDRVTHFVQLGFCTDGDWVKKDTTGKLVWLPQGADERVMGRGVSSTQREEGGSGREYPRILFTGIGRGGGENRMKFVEMMRRVYGRRFTWIPHGCHRKELANMISGHRIVVCPDSPVTNQYWSNRIYNAAGFGACILHPWCGEILNSQYQDDKEIRYYHNILHLHALIDHYLRDAEHAYKLGIAALERTRQEHTYRHRVVELLAVVKERLGVG